MPQEHNTDKRLSRLRNRNVSQLLRFLGEVPPYIEAAIKRQFTRFADDVQDTFVDEPGTHTGDTTHGNEHTQTMA